MKFPALAGEPRMLDEWASKQELEKAGIPVPRGILRAATETTGAAEKIGYPVVRKAVSTDLGHKSEAGAVAVNLADEQAVAAATEGMAMQFDRFLVEKMVAPIVAELIVGLNRDPDCGLTLLIGAGGTLVELVDDTASLLLPATEEDIRNAIESLKVVKLISAYRGGAAGDLDAVVETIRLIADYAVAMADRLVELDVNPLVVQPSGAVAVDALIRQRR